MSEIYSTKKTVRIIGRNGPMGRTAFLKLCSTNRKLENTLAALRNLEAYVKFSSRKLGGGLVFDIRTLSNVLLELRLDPALVAAAFETIAPPHYFDLFDRGIHIFSINLNSLTKIKDPASFINEGINSRYDKLRKLGALEDREPKHPPLRS